MQGIIDQILEGKYDYENCSLDFSCVKVELNIHRGDVYEGSFHVYSTGDFYTQGFVSASDLRMECITTEITGSTEEIFFCFHGEEVEEGDVVKGSFTIISNHGEYSLPFVVNVEHQIPVSSIGNVKNLFHFANLAKNDFDEAVTLFYSPEFPKVFEGSDKQFFECYRGLSACRGNRQNMEEFLIAINKKQRIEYSVREESISREYPQTAYGVMEETLNIIRNGWGYTSLQVECDGDFLFTEKEVCGEDDFLGNKCTLPVFIDTAQCRKGKNFGSVVLYNSHTLITIPVTVCVGEPGPACVARETKKKKLVLLMKEYQQFRMKKINSQEWLKETEALIQALLELDEEDEEIRLYQAQLLISQEKYNEAEWILDQVAEKLVGSSRNTTTLHAYYLYLTTLVNRQEAYINQIAAQVEQLYDRDRSNWRIAWLLLYLSEEYNKTAIGKWEFLEQQFKAGCISPVFYIEGLQLLNANPTLLRRTDEFTLQVLYFGAKEDALNPDISDQLLYLTARERKDSPLLLKTLQNMYQKKEDAGILQEICSMLVRSNKIGPEYFAWYEKGVKSQLRITNLYEYYMMSLDLNLEQELPRIVLLYFSYQNNLDLAHSAFLYAYVVQHKEQLGEFYESYKPRMERFVVDQIQKGRINRALAVLYQELLVPAMINEQTGKALATIVFANQITVSDRRLQRVIVYQVNNRAEHAYPLQDGTTWVPLYGTECSIFFEDAYGNRYVSDIDYTTEKLMLPGKYLRFFAGLVTDCTELDLYLYEHERTAETGTEAYVERALRMCGNEEIDEKLRRKLYLRVLQGMYEQDDLKALDSFLDTLPMGLFDLKERAEILRYLVLRGKTEEAWNWILEYGTAFADPKILLKLLDGQIEKAAETEDSRLTEIGLYSFRQGRYDSLLVSYLVRYGRCSTRELRDIWKAAGSFDIDVYGLSEKILLQMLFSGAFVGEKMEIFRYYAQRGADAQIEQAFLEHCAYDYFVKERVTDEFVFERIAELTRNHVELHRVCKLAFMKFCSENKAFVRDERLSILDDFLQECLAEKIHLNFFRNFITLPLSQGYLLREMMDKTIVEYRAKPGARAKIHYVIMKEDGEGSEYLTEPMREVYGGYCFREFILFFGESLQYYITEERDGQEQLTESGNLQKSDIGSNETDWRYELLNDILISRTLEDYDTLDSLMDEYHRKLYLGENLFTLQ